ncbi:FAD-binding oxidoreductase [Marivita sp. S6314]|uniref:NAD(P)/FAD-dependent oxidoreductase n=1 Tax=Marivita sp. S6314 TaxID=2926406 RepID=UPI001FF2B047|nr:FAD-binding oxidoreductase [Marivita sp. S6314]MCK0150301.1 FAD-binding oxidoreductase [Marivita sp. S6314]
MTRIYEDRAYQTPQACWWRDTVAPAHPPAMQGDKHTDVAIIGGGFTGLNAALVLADAGRQVTVLDAEHPGWGASGRNGGFCCLGGSKLSGPRIATLFGADQRAEWHAAERAAVDHVATLLADHAIDADVHSEGETMMAHSPGAMHDIRESIEDTRQSYGVTPHVFEASDLPSLGLNGRFYGGMTLPIGFALNPGKYHDGLLKSVMRAGAEVFGQTPATRMRQRGSKWEVTTANGILTAERVVIATNGYSSEDMPTWLRARYLPVQSSIIVTRPITDAEQAAQGWTSAQMCYDSRRLLHYFRLMPDGRFLFGMRGGLRATPRSEAALNARIRKNFEQLLPEWRTIDITHAWSGLVCLMRRLTPFSGPVPDRPGMFASLGYHGNGVAMGSYLGARLADCVLDRPTRGPCPAFLHQPPPRFPLGRYRRALLAPTYAAAALLDRQRRF